MISQKRMEAKYTMQLQTFVWIFLVIQPSMANCEHLAAERRGEAKFDWAERSLKQKRNIPEHEQLANWVWRQRVYLGR